MIFDGTWAASIATPLGTQAVVLEIASEQGVVRGRATQGDESVELLDPVVAGDRLTWAQQVTKPLRLRVVCAVTVEGDTMRGTAKAGVFLAAPLTGVRR